MIGLVMGEIIEQKELAERLLTQAKEQGVLVVLAGLPNRLTWRSRWKRNHPSTIGTDVLNNKA